MSTRAGIEGSLTVHLVVGDGTVAGVQLASSRATGIGRLLVGRPVAEALDLVPRLFSLCGTAQTVAALGACERALGIDIPTAQQAAREFLVQAEAVDSHVWQMLLVWPRLLGEPPDSAGLTALRAAKADFVPALFPNRNGLRLGGGQLRPTLADSISALENRLNAAILGPEARAPETLSDLRAWSAGGATPPARLIARVLADDLAPFGRSPVTVLTDRTAEWFGIRLARDPAFAAAPTCDGIPVETGPLGRVAHHPLVRELAALYGNGLATRFIARVIDLLDLPRRLRTAATMLADADPNPAVPHTAVPHTAGTGAGIADTARGRLAHWVALEANGQVTDWRMVAPNEWNFHPQGALARGLIGQAADAGLPPRAKLLVAALDPCVPCHIRIGEP
jgi:uptake hydrogenase large subunit